MGEMKKVLQMSLAVAAGIIIADIVNKKVLANIIK